MTEPEAERAPDDGTLGDGSRIDQSRIDQSRVDQSRVDGPLVHRFLARRDEQAFDALYRRHTPRLYGMALRLTGGDESAAGEIVQETWVRAIAGLGGFRWQAALSSWLCGICANVWREQLRGARPEVALGAVPEPAARGPSPDGTLAHEPLDVRRALMRLAPGYRAVLVLHAIYGYSHAEVAELLGISEGTSKSQLFRGRAALRNDLGVREEDRPS